MTDQLESKIINLCVVKLRNSAAITRVPRLDLDHFESQIDSPRLIQRLPKYYSLTDILVVLHSVRRGTPASDRRPLVT